MIRKKSKSLVGFFVLALMLCCTGTTVYAATTTVWKGAPAAYYDASKVYGNAWRNGYSFTINKLCKKGEKEDKKSYKNLNMWLVATNPKMLLRYNGTGQEKNQWKLAAQKGKTYSYLFVDKKGNVGAQKSGLNAMIQGYGGKNMNTKITHTMN